MSSDRHLLLVKHSLPEPIRGLDAIRWHLSAEGRARCAALADRIGPHAPAALFTSNEPKARETALRLGQALGLPAQSAPNLHEHDRTGVPWLGQDEFESSIRAFFTNPDESVFGRATARQATARFVAAEAILARHQTGTVAVVAHGTVISLYFAAKTGIDPFPLWQRLGLPSLVVLELADNHVVEVVERV